MNRLSLVLTATTFLWACTPQEETGTDATQSVLISSAETPFLMVSAGPKVCSIPDPECVEDLWDQYWDCRSECEFICMQDPDSPQCSECMRTIDLRCPEPDPGQCPTVFSESTCTDCADGILDSYMSCSFKVGTDDFVIPVECDSPWADSADCGPCQAQALSGTLVGRQTCSCEDGSSVSFLCYDQIEIRVSPFE